MPTALRWSHLWPLSGLDPSRTERYQNCIGPCISTRDSAQWTLTYLSSQLHPWRGTQLGLPSNSNRRGFAETQQAGHIYGVAGLRKITRKIHNLARLIPSLSGKCQERAGTFRLWHKHLVDLWNGKTLARKDETAQSPYLVNFRHGT